MNQTSLLRFGFGTKEQEPVQTTSQAAEPTADQSEIDVMLENSEAAFTPPACLRPFHAIKPHAATEPEDSNSTVTLLFGNSDLVHSATFCNKKNCRSVSSAEVQRLRGAKDRFQHDWILSKELTCCLKTGYKWLVYVEKEGMFCLLCRKHNTSNAQNKSRKFNKVGAVRFKRSAIEEHAASNMHQDAVNKELLSRGSTFHKEFLHKQLTRLDAYHKVFQLAYWLAKEEISNRKLARLLEVAQQVGLSDVRYFQHRSGGCVREIFLALGQTVKANVVSAAQKANSFGLLLDEVSDITMKQQLITFVQYVNIDTTRAEVKFLSANDLLANSISANAETIKTVLLQELDNCGLEIGKVSGISSDGASVMLGKRNGLTAKLRNISGCILPVHCICHRLSLACGDANDEISYIKTIENILLNLWNFFENSAKRTAAYSKSIQTLRDINQSDIAINKSKKLQKAVRTRWLSTQNSVTGVFINYHALTQTLSQLKADGDPTATGLLIQIRTLKFLGAVYLLYKVLPILGHLSRAFQKSTFSFASIAPAVQFTLDALKDVATQQTPLKQLHEDLSEGGRLSACDVPSPSEHSDTQLAKLTESYIYALTENINNRFENSLDVLTAFRIFDPAVVPDRSSPQFKHYGLTDIQVISEHFFQMLDENDKIEKSEELKCEWQKFKYNLLELKKEIPRDIKNPPHGRQLISKSTTEWLLEKVLSMRGAYQHFLPLLLHIMEICLSLPVTNAWPERGASALKRLKTKLRNRLNQDMLEALLHISVNGPDVKESTEIVKQAVDKWQKLKDRKKVKPNKRFKPSPSCSDVPREHSDEDVMKTNSDVDSMDSQSLSSDCESDFDLDLFL